MAENSTTRVISGTPVGAFPDGFLPLGAPVALVATGSAATDAAAVTAPFIVTTAGDGTKGIVLPAITAAGQMVAIYNAASGDVKIYPGTSQSINGATATTGNILVEDLSLTLLIATSALNWGAIFTAG